MNLTPLDIRKQRFKNTLRGYNTDEVDAFLEMVADEFEAIIKKNSSLRDQIDDLQSRLNGYIKIDRDLRDTMIMVNKMRESARAEAQNEADQIMQQAESEAEALIGQHRQQQQDLIRQIEQMKADRQSLELKIKAMGKAMTRIIDLEEEASDELKLDLEKLAGADEETLLQNRMNLMQDVRKLQKEKQAYLARLKGLLDMQQQMLDL